MQPVSVTVSVPVPPEEAYQIIDQVSDHERFTNHMLVDWSYSGPKSGVGARARMRVKKLGRADWDDLEVVNAQPPLQTTEESVSASGRRRRRGTYSLEQLPAGGTRITFTLTWLQAPITDRLLAPLTRAYIRRGNQRALDRLAEQLPAIRSSMV